MVKSVYINTGEEVLVDDEDYPVVSRYSWRKVSLLEVMCCWKGEVEVKDYPLPKPPVEF